MAIEHITTAEYARYFKGLYPLAKLAIGLSHDLTVSGQDNIPEGPAVFAANHKSVLDPLFLAVAYYEHTHGPIHFLAKKEYFEGGGIDDKGKFGRTVRMLVTKTGQIPVDRSSRHGNEESIAAAVAMLDSGDAVGIFPEGTLVAPGRLGRLHKGAAEIALKAGDGGVPIVPVAILQSEKGSARRTAVSVEFGAPIDTTEINRGLGHLKPMRFKAGAITNDLEDVLADLTGCTKTGAFAKPGELRYRLGN